MRAGFAAILVFLSGHFSFGQEETEADPFALQVRSTQPLPATEQAKTFRLPPGFTIQLVSAEPDIAKPMNLAFDRRGRLWVSSSLEYPYAAPEDQPARDTIKILEDTTGDGYHDKVTTFADGLNIPMGLYPYGDGVICFSIPYIWHLRDTDGDDRADVREKLYGPFDCTRDTHGMCNAFTRGLDGWLYACHGFNNQSTVAGRDGHEITMQSGNTFRIRLDGSRIEHHAYGQVNPFGLTFDRLGDLFSADCHTKPINLIMAGGYHDSFGKPHDGLGYVPNIMEHLHHSTGIAGIALGEGTHFPKAYQNDTFGGNVVTSRINRNHLKRIGSSIVAEEAADFLISKDPWFRPVDLQIGPDGALYVADFYNSIIGHYEVPLDHPKRDRHRGRIWRIAFEANDTRHSPDLTKVSTADLFSLLAEANLTLTTLIVDELTLRGEARNILDHWDNHEFPETTRVALLWSLHRLDGLPKSALSDATQHESPFVRTHAYQLLAERPKLFPDAVDVSDPSPIVLRAAITAAGHAGKTTEILAAHTNAPQNDVHLLHSLKIALKRCLSDPKSFNELNTQSFTKDHFQLVGNVCLALPHEAAGNFLIEHLEQYNELPPHQLAAYLRHAARATDTQALPKVVELGKSIFADDREQQRNLLVTVHEGLKQRGISDSEALAPLRVWAAELAQHWLGAERDDEPVIPWTSDNDTWQISEKRASADTKAPTRLWSSFPAGESKRGTSRSAPFELQDSFEFWHAGHDGPPGRDVQKRNIVRLRKANTNEALKTAIPPRNDTAQPVRWDTSPWKGQQALLELVDQDSGSAFAWHAAGRFSIKGLNPSTRTLEQSKAAQLIREFNLASFLPDITTVLSRQKYPNASTASLAQAYLALQPESSAHKDHLAKALALQGNRTDLKLKALRAILNGTDADCEALLGEWMQTSPQSTQLRLAEILATTKAGSTSLLKWAESQIAPASLLVESSVAPLLENHLTESQQQTRKKLTENLPDQDATLQTLIEKRITSYRQHGGNVSNGGTLFKKHCSLCHQLEGAGTALGPNLDGLGNRGLERLTEDVLDPNRNVDVAFRLTTLSMKDGRTLVGLIKRTEGSQTILADPTGKESSIPTSAIADKQALALSLMPATFASALSENEFRDLQAYLLSLRH